VKNDQGGVAPIVKSLCFYKKDSIEFLSVSIFTQVNAVTTINFKIPAFLLGLWLFSSIAIAQPLTSVAIDTLSQDTLLYDSLQTMLADSANGPDTVEYRAMRLFYDYPKKVFVLKEKAQLKYQGATLDADTIEYDQENMVLQATGLPVIKDKENPPLSGYRMKYNIKKKLGQIYYGSTRKDGQHFNGMDIRRLEDGRLQINRGDFCACNHPEPDYFFYSRRMVVTPQEKVVASPVVLNIQQVPVAVLPLLISPLKGGRRSGLLVPKFGGDQSQGFYIENIGYYWAISEYMDYLLKGALVEGPQATFDDTRLNSEFRYKKRYVLDGSIGGTAYMNQFNPANSGWDVRFSHNQNITPDGMVTLRGGGSFVSSQRLRQDKGLNEETVLNQQANANMTYSHRFENGKNLNIRMSQDHNLTTGYLTRDVPYMNYSMGGPLIPATLRHSSDTAINPHWYEKINYNYNWTGNVFYTKSYDSLQQKDSTQYWPGFRDALNFDYTGNLFDVINVTPSINLEGNWTPFTYQSPYDSLNNSMFFHNDLQDNRFGDYFLRHSYSLRTDTKLYGIIKPEIGRFTGIRHVITPSLGYTYAPEIDSNLFFVPHPRLHSYPYQSEQKTVSMGFANDFDLKYLLAPEMQDTTKQKTHNTLRFLSTRSNTGYNFAALRGFNWSPINTQVTVQPAHQYSFSFNMAHSFYHKYSADPLQTRTPQLTSYSFGLGRDLRWNGEFNAGLPAQSNEYETTPWNAGFSYYMGYGANRIGPELFQENISHSSNGHLELQPTRNWKMRYNTSYDFVAGNFARHEFRFSRKLRCWQMQFTWTPVGPSAGWSFLIFATELPDIKLQTANTNIQRGQ
jgi:lipopolysaccharide assembly outer membrane protein LptD (OstA)